MNEELRTIDGLPAKEAIRQDRVKNAPYTIRGHQYVPMTVTEAEAYEAYKETGIASWYGEETRRAEGGRASITETIMEWGAPSGKRWLSDGRIVYTWTIPWAWRSVDPLCTIVITASAENTVEAYTYRHG